MARLRPSWQMMECPAWCVREHDEEDRGGDRDHQSEAVYFPVIELVRRATADGEYGRLEMPEIALAVLIQGEKDQRPWLSFGLAEVAYRSLELSPESAERLVEAVQALLPFTQRW